MIQCIYEDEELIVVEKPAGVESQEAGTFSEDMVNKIRNYLCHRNGATACGKTAYVGVVHRLDKPVRGIMVYAKTQEAAAALSRQVQDKEGRQMQKIYYALTIAGPEGEEYLSAHPKGKLTHEMLFQKKGNVSVIVTPEEKKKYPPALQKEVRQAELRYEEVSLNTFPGFEQSQKLLETILSEEERGHLHLLRVELLTGRHHQIRLQLAHIGCPIIGDRKYNTLLTDNRPGMRMVPLCLCAAKLGFIHPKTGKRMEFELSE